MFIRYIYYLFFVFFLISNGFQLESTTTSYSRRERPIVHYSFLSDTIHFFEKKDMFLSVKPIFIDSWKSDELAPAFFFDEKKELLIATDNIHDFYKRDIRGELLGLEKYRGFLTVNPNASLNGLLCLFEVKAGSFFSSYKNSNVSFKIKTALSSTQHRLPISLTGGKNKETDQIKKFFYNQPHASFYEENRNAIGLENITLMLANSYVPENKKLHLDYYGGLEIPTQGRVDSTTLFSPHVGNNGYWGFVSGGHIMLNFFDNNRSFIAAFLSGENRYWVHKEMKRSFDLKNKPWSRYLKTINKKTLEISNLSDVLNIPVKTYPCNSFDLSCGFLCKPIDFMLIKFGYNIAGVSQEFIFLKDHRYPGCYNNILNHGLKGVGFGKTASLNTISSQGVDDPSFVPFRIEDIDLESGLSPSAYSQSVFITLISESDFGKGECGGFLEWGQKGVMLSKRGFWIGCSFNF